MKRILIIFCLAVLVSPAYSIFTDTLVSIRLTLPNPCEEALQIEEPAQVFENQLSLYPNPGKGSFTLKISGKELSGPGLLEITNIQGSVLYTEIIQLDLKQHRLDLSLLLPGVYLVAIKQESFLPVKLVVQ